MSSPQSSAPSIEIVRRQLLAILREGVEGPGAEWSYFTDHGTGAGLLGSLTGRDPEEVSVPGEGGRATVAGHVHHTGFGMEASTAFIRGDRSPRDWGQSWKVTAVDGGEWKREMDVLRARYQALLRTMQEADLSTDEAFGGAVAAVAHVAYHLGAIRQRLLPASSSGGHPV